MSLSLCSRLVKKRQPFLEKPGGMNGVRVGRAGNSRDATALRDAPRCICRIPEPPGRPFNTYQHAEIRAEGDGGLIAYLIKHRKLFLCDRRSSADVGQQRPQFDLAFKMNCRRLNVLRLCFYVVAGGGGSCMPDPV